MRPYGTGCETVRSRRLGSMPARSDLLDHGDVGARREGALNLPGHSRARSRPRAWVRAISLSQTDTDWFVVAPNRAAIRQRGANVSETPSSASPGSASIP